MDKKNAGMSFYRAACWIGVAVDALWIIPMLVPEWGLSMYGLGKEGVTPILRYGLAVGAALMAGWTVLLAWASFDPERRRAVLLMTLVPVKLGLDAASLIPLATGMLGLGRFLLLKADAIILYPLFIAAYLAASPRRGRGAAAAAGHEGGLA